MRFGSESAPGRAGGLPGDFKEVTRDEDLWVAQSGASIHHLYVDPDHLRQGVGRALLSVTLGRGGCRAELKCDEANRRAQAFYPAVGWRPVGWGWAPNGPWIRFAYRRADFAGP